jgi:hypothetical protein
MKLFLLWNGTKGLTLSYFKTKRKVAPLFEVTEKPYTLDPMMMTKLNNLPIFNHTYRIIYID